MDTLKWRNRARIVGYVDLVLTSMGLLFVILFGIYVGLFTAAVSDDDSMDPETKSTLQFGVILLWIVVAFTVVCACIELWAAIKLVNGTDIGREHNEAMKAALIWRKVTVSFLISQVVLLLLQGAFISLVIAIAFRGTLLYIVHNFMEELKFQIASGPDPIGVTVKN